MAPSTHREPFIPLHRGDLIELLCETPGLTAADADKFRDFCRLAATACHFEYHRRMERLKPAYARFDPDADAKNLFPESADQHLKSLNDLFAEFKWLMEHAQFKHLTLEEIEPALRRGSDWGLPMDVDFRVFERLAMFARGATVQTRVRRRWRSLWRTVAVEVPIYQRLVMIFKLRPHPRLDRAARTDCVFFQIFKNIPQLDITMLLPGARVRLPFWDRVRIFLSLAGGLAVVVWNVFHQRRPDLSFGAEIGLDLAVLALLFAAFGYLAKSYLAFQRARTRLHLNLVQILFYQNLDTNSGVLFRLLDEAEEQECREVLLAYFHLWRHAGESGWTEAELDQHVEKYLEETAQIEVDFESAAALAAMQRLRIVGKTGDRYRAVPMDATLQRLAGT